MYKVKLSVLDDFKCLAGDCPASCCSYGWNIYVEDDIIEKWKALEDDKVRGRLLEAVIEETEENKVNYLLGNSTRLCPLKESDGLCYVHANLGEAYLGSTCKNYPRRERTYPTYQLQSATMSCPEIARLIVSSPINESLFVSEEKIDEQPTPPFLINHFVSRVLSKDKFSIAARIICISRMLVKLSTLSKQGDLDLQKLISISRAYSKPLNDAERDIKSGRLKHSPGSVNAFWKMVFFFMREEFTLNFDERISHHRLIGLLKDRSKSEEHITHIVNEINQLRTSAEPEMKKLMTGIGRKYLETKFHSIGFPLNPIADNYIAAFLYGVLPYSFINLTLWLIYDEQKKLTVDDVIGAIYRAERLSQHTDRIYLALARNHDVLNIYKYEDCFADLL